MRILHINDFFHGGGAESIFQSLVCGSQNMGHKSFTATTRFLNPSENFKVDCIEHSIPFLLLRRTIFVNNDPLAYKTLGKIFQKVRPDIIHCHNLYHISLAPVIIARNSHIPCLITIHDYWPICPKRSLIQPGDNICEKRNWDECFFYCKHQRVGWALTPFAKGAFRKRINLLSANDKIKLISVSNFVKQTLLNFGLEQVRTIYNGIDTSKFIPTSNNLKKNIVIYVGPDLKNKGFYEFLEVAKKVKEKIPEVKFVAIGGKSRYITRNVEAVGKVSGTDLRNFYQTATCICIPPLWPEPLPTIALEAMACGTPVIAYPMGGLMEIVEDGKTGFLIERNCTDEMSNKVVTLLRDEKLAAHLGKNARKRVLEMFNLNKMIDNYNKIYTGLYKSKNFLG